MRYIVSFLSVLFIFSCGERMEYPMEYYQEKLVINALLETGKPVTVNLSRSYWGDSSNMFIKNGLVSIITDHGADTLSYEGNGNYSSNIMVEPNNEYKFKIITEEYSTIQVLTEVPEIVDFDSKQIVVVENGWKNAVLALTISDDTCSENHYMVRLWAQSDTVDTLLVSYFEIGTESIDYYTYTWQCVEANTLPTDVDDFFSPDNNDKIFTDGVIFSDNSFVNGEKQLQIEPSYFGDSIALFIALYQLNSDLYRYYQSMASYQRSEDNLFSTPSSLYSNIGNGLGLISSRSVCYDTVYFKTD